MALDYPKGLKVADIVIIGTVATNPDAPGEAAILLYTARLEAFPVIGTQAEVALARTAILAEMRKIHGATGVRELKGVICAHAHPKAPHVEQANNDPLIEGIGVTLVSGEHFYRFICENTEKATILYQNLLALGLKPA